MVIGDREALGWILSTQQTAFPAARRGEAAKLAAGDRMLVYTTRGCFHNPTRDQGRVIAEAEVQGPAVRDDEPVRFGERAFPLRCPLLITELAPFGSGVVLADHVENLHVFPDTRSWSVRLRRSPVPVDDHDHRYLTERLRKTTRPLAEAVEDYTARATPAPPRR
ncbi:hypothetical protein EKD16_06435 [Streptomonospora litoralis]|uniref:EVE domain-containing protein n=2 Tax=Streptomonospora litoralis TaxID=2498135 RepID=A0A4P6PY56_9ACTN|nr:hypothetical protein EKD16_06435 [Streptomonospora litoralis]